jgi:hypothetical protein
MYIILFYYMGIEGSDSAILSNEKCCANYNSFSLDIVTNWGYIC